MSCHSRLNLLSSTALLGAISTFLQFSVAQAECLPESENNLSEIICSGSVSTSYVSSVSNLEIKVSPDAVMTGEPAFTLSGNSKTLINEGVIQSGTIGINNRSNLNIENSNLISGDDYGIVAEYGTINIVNHVGGVIRGNTAISSFPNYYGGTYDITNDGRIEGTNGAAIETPSNLTLNNNEDGQIIGGISLFRELKLDNAGLIDGGDNYAIKKQYYAAYNSTLNNSGTITSAVNNDYTAFILSTEVFNSGVIEATGVTGGALFVAAGSVTNSGKIQAKGNGIALTLSGTTLINEKDGEIISNGTAITGSSVRIINKGAIVGDVDFSGYGSWYSETYRDMGGTIEGDLLFGFGNDIFLYDYDMGTGLDSVSGTVDPGEGFDAYGVTAEGEVTLTPSLPDGFEQFAVEVRGNDSTITLSPLSEGSSFESPLLLMGDGKVINNTSLNISKYDHAAISLQASSDSAKPGITLINNANIISHAIGSYAIYGEQNSTIQNNATLTTYGSSSAAIYGRNISSVVNTGDINTSGNNSFGINVRSTGSNSEKNHVFDNSGAVSTTGESATGLYLSGGGLFTNSGEIKTSGDNSIGTYLIGEYNNLQEFENTGTIITTGHGATGVAFFRGSTLINSGTIKSTQHTAIHNAVSNYGVRLINKSDGIIFGGNGIAVGGRRARNFELDNAGSITGDIFFDQDSYYYSCGDQKVTNSGTITGSVLLGKCNDIFIHEGGTVSGVVDLGDDDDTFILNLDTGAMLSDISGGVIAGEGIDTFAYSSELETSVNIAPISGFEIFGVIAEGADANITLNTTDDFLTEYFEVSGEGEVISNVSFKRDLADTYPYGQAIITLQSDVTFTNKADIELGSVGTLSKSAVFVDLGTTFNNDGTITALADNAIGITSGENL